MHSNKRELKQISFENLTKLYGFLSHLRKPSAFFFNSDLKFDFSPFLAQVNKFCEVIFMDFMNVSHNKARQQKNAGSANTGASEKLEVVKEEKREKSRDRSRNREERGERGERGGREERGGRDIVIFLIKSTCCS